MAKEITIEIKNLEILLFFAFLLLFFYLEVSASLKAPIAFGDEGFHTRMAQYIGQEKEYPVWVPFFGTKVDKQGFSRPPFWNIFEGSLYMIFGFRDSIVKFIVPFMATIIIGLSYYILIKKLYDKETGMFASIIAVTVPSLVTYSVLMYTDVLFTLYYSLFVLTLMLAFKTKKEKYLLVSGIFAGISIITKLPGVSAGILIGLAFLYRLYKEKNLVKLIKPLLFVTIPVLVIVGSFVLRNLVYYKTPYCGLPFFDNQGCNLDAGYKPKYEYAGRTEEVGTEMNPFKMGITNYLDFAYGGNPIRILGYSFGNLRFVSLVCILGLFLMFFKKREIDILLLFLFIAFLPVIYKSIFGRAEDTARYTLGLLSIISIAGASYLKEIFDFIQKNLKGFAFIVLIFVVVFGLQNLREKLFAAWHYDDNAKRYVGYKAFSPAFFEACDWAKNNLPEDARIGGVVWGSATAYNCQRKVGGGSPDVSLSNNLTLALSVLNMQGVSHLFIQKFTISWGDEKLSERYPISYVEFLENHPDNFKKIYENGPPLDQCKQAGGCDGAIFYELNYTGVELIPASEFITKDITIPEN